MKSGYFLIILFHGSLTLGTIPLKNIHSGLGRIDRPLVSFSSCQRNLIKTFQIEGMIALIAKMDLISSLDLLKA